MLPLHKFMVSSSFNYAKKMHSIIYYNQKESPTVLKKLILFMLLVLPQRLGVLHIMMMCCWAHSRA